MRRLIELTVIDNYKTGLNDVNVRYLTYRRSRKGMPPLEFTTIEALVNELTDEELLMVLESQFCDKYR